MTAQAVEARATTPNRIAVGYVRVSTAKQEIGPDAQRHAIEVWCARHGYTLRVIEADEVTGEPREFSSEIDHGVAVTRLDLRPRPGLLRALEASKGAEVLIAAKRDRFFRHAEALAQFTRLVQPARLVSADMDLEHLGAAAPIVVAVTDAAAVAELHRIRSRTTEALATKRRAGQRTGGVTYGWRDPEAHLRPEQRDPTRKLVPVPEEQAAIGRILELETRGLGPRAIATRLTAEGHRPRAAKWHPNTIRRILKRNKGKTA